MCPETGKLTGVWGSRPQGDSYYLMLESPVDYGNMPKGVIEAMFEGVDWVVVGTQVSAVVVALFGFIKALQGLVKIFRRKV